MRPSSARPPPSPEILRAAIEDLARASQRLEAREAAYLASGDRTAERELHRARGLEVDALLRAERARQALRGP